MSLQRCHEKKVTVALEVERVVGKNKELAVQILGLGLDTSPTLPCMNVIGCSVVIAGAVGEDWLLFCQSAPV